MVSIRTVTGEGGKGQTTAREKDEQAFWTLGNFSTWVVDFKGRITKKTLNLTSVEVNHTDFPVTWGPGVIRAQGFIWPDDIALTACFSAL